MSNIDKVSVRVNLEGAPMRTARIELISPDGTTSMVLEEGIPSNRTTLNFEFTSNTFWGEDLDGVWQVRIYDTSGDGKTFTVNDIEMRAIGDNDDSHSTFYYTDQISLFSMDSSRLIISDTGELSHELNISAVSVGQTLMSLI